MKTFSRIGIEELQFLASYLLKNRDNVDAIIKEFGEVSSSNGYGTTFLEPYDPLFKTFFIYQKDGRVESVGFGGSNLGLRLYDLHSFYKLHTEGFDRFADEYIYMLYENDDYTYVIRVSSKNKLFNDNRILNDIEINGVSIVLR